MGESFGRGPGNDQVAILLPRAERFRRPPPQPLAPRLAGIRNARIGLIDNGFAAGSVIHDQLRALLSPYDISTVVVTKKYWVPLDNDQLDRLEKEADAIVSGLCNSPPSTAWGVRDCAALEKRGKPTAILATSHYADLLAETVVWESVPDLRRVILPYPLEGQAESAIHTVVRQSLPKILDALCHIPA